MLPPILKDMEWPRADADHLLLSSAAMQGLEQELFASGLPVAALMEHAGLGLAAAVRQAPQLQQRGVVVLVGPGHNGGDGLVVARELHNNGIEVRIWSPYAGHKPLTAEHLRHAEWLGIPRLQQPPAAGESALWLDALFGIQQQRPLDGEVAQLIQQRNDSGQELWSIDGPSGLCSDSGRPIGAVTARCRRSLVVGCWKQGLWQDEAMAWVGQQQRVPLNLPMAVLQRWGESAVRGLWSSDRCQNEAPWPQLAAAASKHGRGRLRVLAGSSAYPGAARLALEGASASGLGWLEAVLPQSLEQQLWQVLPHVVLKDATSPLERLDAIAYGPGLGSGPLRPDLQTFPGLLLLDADGVNRLAAQGDGRHWLLHRQGPTWLTPHRAEFNRLFPELVACTPLEAAHQAALASGCWVLLKGARTVIASPQGPCRQILESSCRAARAGLGDVLAGYAAGLGAQGFGASGDGQHTDLEGLLALAALEHASAGMRCSETGRGTATPLAVAHALQRSGNQQIKAML